MMGEKLRVSLFGQSHGAAIGVVMDGLPAGEEIDLRALRSFLRRRAPGGGGLSTSRQEKDEPRFLSGLLDGRTCGAPLCAIIENTDARPEDYREISDLPRPSHCDYPARLRYGGYEDARGGGHFSGRLTAPLCVAGGVAMQILKRRGIHLGAHAEQVGAARDRQFHPTEVTLEDLALPAARRLPVLDESKARAMEGEILSAAGEGDSVGGIVECAALGMPAGIGDPLFGSMENRLSSALFGIPGVRGVEFGSGFAAAAMRGSRHNDPYRLRDGRVVTETNHHGGILGGITTGMPLLFRVALKPTSSIAMEQKTVDLATMTEKTMRVPGRHDPCIVFRAVPCVEAAAGIVLLDSIL
jgi:chorismate synthase